jgi:hypothetical protein
VMENLQLLGGDSRQGRNHVGLRTQYTRQISNTTIRNTQSERTAQMAVVPKPSSPPSSRSEDCFHNLHLSANNKVSDRVSWLQIAASAFINQGKGGNGPLLGENFTYQRRKQHRSGPAE